MQCNIYGNVKGRELDALGENDPMEQVVFNLSLNSNHKCVFVNLFQQYIFNFYSTYVGIDGEELNIYGVQCRIALSLTI